MQDIAQQTKQQMLRVLAENDIWHKLLDKDGDLIIRHSPSATSFIHGDGRITTQVQGQQTLEFDSFSMWLYWLDN